MPKYVPASWVAIWKSRSWEIRTKAIEFEGAVQGILVCKLTKLGFGNANTATNAHLIAAAPDMLDALKSVETHHIALNAKYGRPEANSHTLSIVRVAIAKAEGRQ